MDFQNRQYDPQIGRFLSVDPLADDDQEEWSPYAAMGNNPAMMVDPLGLKGDNAQSIQGNPTAQEYPGTEYKGVLFFQSKNAPLQSVDGGALANYLITGNSKALFGERIQQGSGKTAGNDLSQENDGNKMKAEPGEKLGEGAYDHTATMPDGNDLPMTNVEDKKTESNWYAKGGQYNWTFATFATAIEKTEGSFRLTNGAYNGSVFSPKYYASAWRGGSRARITTYNIGKIGGLLGKISFGTGVVMDGIGVWNYYKNPNSSNVVHPGKAVLNTGVGAFGLWVNPAAGILYFGVDAFYPGGWPGYANDYDKLQKANEAILGPRFITAPYGSQKF